MKQYKVTATLNDGRKISILNNTAKNMYESVYFSSIEDAEKAIERDKKIDDRIADVIIREREISVWKVV